MPGVDKSLTIRAANCGETGKTTISVMLNGQTTPQIVGSQDLVIVQKRGGVIEQVTAVITVGTEQIWPQ